MSTTTTPAVRSAKNRAGLPELRSIELFSGAGGLALGTQGAGFKHEVLVEWNADACATLRSNLASTSVHGIGGWNVVQGDIRNFDFSQFEGTALVAGGPPCQPFSIGGKHNGSDDARNMIPEFVRAVREIRPRAFMMENVRGLTRPGFRPYFEYVLESLRRPTIGRRQTESWQEHLARLRRSGSASVAYDVSFKVLNAADFGVPQSRHRVFIVGFRSDLGVHYEFPQPTHSSDLLRQAKASGEYWRQHGIKPRNELTQPEGLFPTCEPGLLPWRTVRDAIGDLPEPSENRDSPTVANHRLQSGAKPYPGHTGSDLDEPAKTLKAGDHGVPGGENMLRRPDGTVRYFTIREAARIQTFPDEWHFEGAWSEGMRQLGNAVPVRLAEAVARSVRAALEQ